MEFKVIYKKRNTPGNPGVYIYLDPTNGGLSGKRQEQQILREDMHKLIYDARKSLLEEIFTLVDNFDLAYTTLSGSGKFSIKKQTKNLIGDLKIFLDSGSIIVIDKKFDELLHDKIMTLIGKAGYDNHTYSRIIYDLENNIINFLYDYSYSLKNQEGGFRKRSTQRKRTPRTRKVVQTRKKRY
jgi:hypothetical protein